MKVRAGIFLLIIVQSLSLSHDIWLNPEAVVEVSHLVGWLRWLVGALQLRWTLELDLIRTDLSLLQLLPVTKFSTLPASFVKDVLFAWDRTMGRYFQFHIMMKNALSAHTWLFIMAFHYGNSWEYLRWWCASEKLR